MQQVNLKQWSAFEDSLYQNLTYADLPNGTLVRGNEYRIQPSRPGLPGPRAWDDVLAFEGSMPLPKSTATARTIDSIMLKGTNEWITLAHIECALREIAQEVGFNAMTPALHRFASTVPQIEPNVKPAPDGLTVGREKFSHKLGGR